jgi:hypothetical protein
LQRRLDGKSGESGGSLSGKALERFDEKLKSGLQNLK